MTALGEHAAYEQAPMAVGGVFLAADQGYTEPLHAGFQALDGCLEPGIVAEPTVKHVARRIVIIRIRRPAA